MVADKRNRKQRKELRRQLQSANPGLEVVHPKAAGIDVGNGAHYVAVRPDQDPEPVRRFECFTADLHRLADDAGLRPRAKQSERGSTVFFGQGGRYDLHQFKTKVEATIIRNAAKDLPKRKSPLQVKLYDGTHCHISPDPQHDSLLGVFGYLRTAWWTCGSNRLQSFHFGNATNHGAGDRLHAVIKSGATWPRIGVHVRIISHNRSYGTVLSILSTRS